MEGQNSQGGEGFEDVADFAVVAGGGLFVGGQQGGDGFEVAADFGVAVGVRFEVARGGDEEPAFGKGDAEGLGHAFLRREFAAGGGEGDGERARYGILAKADETRLAVAADDIGGFVRAAELGPKPEGAPPCVAGTLGDAWVPDMALLFAALSATAPVWR